MRVFLNVLKIEMFLGKLIKKCLHHKNHSLLFFLFIYLSFILLDLQLVLSSSPLGLRELHFLVWVVLRVKSTEHSLVLVLLECK